MMMSQMQRLPVFVVVLTLVACHTNNPEGGTGGIGDEASAGSGAGGSESPSEADGGAGGSPAAPIAGPRTHALKTNRGLDEWPQFAFSALNVATIDARVPVNPHLAWTLKLPGNVAYATPIVGDHKVFVTMYPSIAAVDSRDGKLLWNNTQLKLGKYGTAAYHGGRMFVAAGSIGNKISTIVALDSETGAQVWQSDLASWGALKIHGDSLYATDREVSFALDLETGATRWKTKAGCASDPAVFEGHVYCAGQSSLVVLSAATGVEVSRTSTGVALFVSTPAIADGLIFFVGENGLYAHTIDDGKLRWKAAFAPANRQQQGGTWIETSPAVAYGKVFVVGEGNVSAFNAATGELVWSKLVEHAGGTTVAVADGTVLVNGSLLLDSDHGHLLWKAPNDLQAFGTPVVVDGHFYVATGDRLVAWSGSVPGEPIE